MNPEANLQALLLKLRDLEQRAETLTLEAAELRGRVREIVRAAAAQVCR
jgi:hypothetical protein